MTPWRVRPRRFEPTPHPASAIDPAQHGMTARRENALPGRIIHRMDEARMDVPALGPVTSTPSRAGLPRRRA
jgi:hypothetical protein